MALSDTACRSARPKGGDFKLSDGQGLFLLVKSNGTKLWRQYYRVNRKQTTISLGNYPAVSLADARELRDRNRRLLAFGRDPQKVKRSSEGDDISFRAWAKAYHDNWKAGKTDGYADLVWSRLDADALPYIGDTPIMDVTSADVLRVIRRVEARGALDVARRLKQKLSEVFAYAIAEQRITTNPTSGLDKALKPRPKVKHHAMVGVSGVPALVQAIRSYEGDKVTRLALEFTLLTGVRTEETRFMAWSEVEAGVWRIPAARMKMGLEHLVPLSRQARALLAEARPMARNSLVFPGDAGEAMSNNTMLFALYRMGYRGRQTVHGFRRLFSTILNENGFNADWVEMQLAHREEDDVRAAYNAAQYLPGRRDMLQWWADYLDAPGCKYEDLLG